MFASEVYSLTAFCLFLFLVSLTKSFGNPIVFEHLWMRVHVLYRQESKSPHSCVCSFQPEPQKASFSIPRAEADLSSTSSVFSAQRPWCTGLSQSYLSLWELSCSFLVHGPQPKWLISKYEGLEQSRRHQVLTAGTLKPGIVDRPGAWSSGALSTLCPEWGKESLLLLWPYSPWSQWPVLCCPA